MTENMRLAWGFVILVLALGWAGVCCRGGGLVFPPDRRSIFRGPSAPGQGRCASPAAMALRAPLDAGRPGVPRSLVAYRFRGRVPRGDGGRPAAVTSTGAVPVAWLPWPAFLTFPHPLGCRARPAARLPAGRGREVTAAGQQPPRRASDDVGGAAGAFGLNLAPRGEDWRGALLFAPVGDRRYDAPRKKYPRATPGPAAFTGFCGLGRGGLWARPGPKTTEARDYCRVRGFL
jgi:hypothetical protein